MNRLIAVGIFLILGSLSVDVQAQRYSLTDSVTVFGSDVKRLLRKAPDSTSARVGREFEALWGSGSLSDRHKDSVMAISHRMTDINFNIIPYFRDFYAILVYAVDSAEVPDQRLDEYLSITKQVIEKYRGRELTSYFRTLRTFFYNRALYVNNYNQLFINGEEYTWSLEYIPSAEPVAALPLPVEEEPEEENKEDEYLSEEDFEQPKEVTQGSDDNWGNNDDGWGDNEWGDDNWGNNDSWGEEEGSDDWNNESWGSDDGWGNAPEESGKEENKQESSDGFASREEPAAPSEDERMDALVQELPQPEPVGPVMHLESTNLVMSTRYDSANLTGAKGTLMLTNGTFVGEGGKFDWVNAGYASDSVYATLGKYNFNVKTPRLEAENVKMTFKGKIKGEVPGILRFTSQKHDSTTDATYPRFKSYKSDVSVDVYNDTTYNNIITYTGGFTLEGNKIYSSSYFGNPSTLEIQNNSVKKVKLESEQMVMGDSIFTADDTRLVLYHGYDSIYHPSVDVRYLVDSAYLTAVNHDGSYHNVPFKSTYFNMEITSDIVRWHIPGDSINISTLSARGEVPTLLASTEYFNEKMFNQMTGMYRFHPLILAVAYARQNNSETFYADDLADDRKQNPQVVRSAMKELAVNGFIDYEPVSGKVTIQQKAMHYVLSKAKRKDYDDLLIPSLTAANSNATLYLENQEMRVRGIEKFYISEQLDVYITPDSAQLTMLKNRDFRFNGNLFAGNFEFVGADFEFKYEDFKIDLAQIDSIRFYLTDENGQRKQVDNSLVSADSTAGSAAMDNLGLVGNQIKQTSGTLFVNDPRNKSARKFLPEYPKFDASNGAVVYFDGKNVLDGAYDKRVYFVIPPFAVDSVSSTDPGAIGFDGTFYTDGLLPPIDETLRVMEDNTLGFAHNIPAEGYNLYSGSGKLYSNLRLDGKGLTAAGTIEYLTASMTSEDYILYQDSLVTKKGLEADITEGELNGASFPQAYVENFTLKWLPQQDSMNIYNNAEPFQFYNQTASMDGAAIVTQKGLRGQGTLFTRGSEATSNDMRFQQSQFSARNADFEVKSSNPVKPALAGDDVFLDFNLEDNFATINPEVEGVAAIEFPYAQFKTSITEAVWNLNQETVTMSKPEDVPIESSYFYATRKSLDSLAFNAESATYKISKQELDVFGVPFIKVADAKVVPDSNLVHIQENAQFSTFTNAELIIDTLNEYHNLYDGTIEVLSRNKFRGKATYEFVNAEEDTFAIELNDFRKEEITDEDGNVEYAYTTAKGVVPPESPVEISTGFLYKGRLRMNAINPALVLDGEIKLDFKTIPDYNTWIQYESDAKQQEVALDFEQSVDTRMRSLNAGLHLNGRTNELYSTFVMNPETGSDRNIFKPKGILSFDRNNNQYVIESPAKINDGSYSGEIFTFNENTRQVTYEGPIQYFEDLESDGVTVKAGVKGTGDLENKAFTFETSMVINFNELPGQVYDIMGEDINEILETTGAQSAVPDKTTMLYRLSEIIGNEAAKRYEKESLSEYTPLLKAAGILEEGMNIPDVSFKWSAEHKAWYSTSNIGLANSGDMDINASLSGFIEIKPDVRQGDKLNVFIQAGPDSWFFFGYQNFRLSVWSSNQDLNDLVFKKTNIDKAEPNEFAFFAGDVAETLTFVNRFRQQYLGITEPYSLDSPMDIANEEEVVPLDEDADRDGF